MCFTCMYILTCFSLLRFTVFVLLEQEYEQKMKAAEQQTETGIRDSGERQKRA